MSKAETGGEETYPQKIREAPCLLDGEPEPSSSVNELLEPNVPVVETDEENGFGPELTGYDEEKGYDRQLLKLLYDRVSKWSDGFSDLSEMLSIYADPSMGSPLNSSTAFKQLEAVKEAMKNAVGLEGEGTYQD